MILIISTCQHKLHELEFIMPLVNIFPESKVIHYKNLEKEYDTADGIIISGTSLQDEEYLRHIKKFDWLRTYKKPVVGICAGAQIIAKQYWASLRKHKEIGQIRIKNAKAPLPEEFTAYALHQNSIEALSDFKILAKNDILQAFQVDNNIGLLFHPEVRNEKMLKDIFINEYSPK